MTARPLATPVAARLGGIPLDQLAELADAYGFRAIRVGPDHLTAERHLGPKLDVVVFTRVGGAKVAWRGAYFAHGISGIRQDGTTPVPHRVQVAQRESGFLLTLESAQDFLARLP